MFPQFRNIFDEIGVLFPRIRYKYDEMGGLYLKIVLFDYLNLVLLGQIICKHSNKNKKLEKNCRITDGRTDWLTDR